MIRDLNDEINKAMREKHMWEVQIRNLGGPNYMRGGGLMYDEEGKEIPGSGKGYRYAINSPMVLFSEISVSKNFPRLTHPATSAAPENSLV